MQAAPIARITRRREIAERYQRLNRLWLGAQTAYRRLHESPVLDLSAMRSAALRLDQLANGRAALLRDLKAMAD